MKLGQKRASVSLQSLTSTPVDYCMLWLHSVFFALLIRRSVLLLGTIISRVLLYVRVLDSSTQALVVLLASTSSSTTTTSTTTSSLVE